MTWDRRKCSLFTVEGCSPKTNRVISPIVKYMEKMGPGKSVHYKGVFTNQGCWLWEVSLYISFNMVTKLFGGKFWNSSFWKDHWTLQGCYITWVWMANCVYVMARMLHFHTCQPREKFWRDKRGATERSELTSEGGSGGPPPENFKNLHCKWCILRYSWAIFVNIISLYGNKTMQVLLQYRLIVILNCRYMHILYMLVPVHILMKLMQKAG